VDIVCLQETKLELITRRIVNSLWGCHYVDWCYVVVIGAVGGILLMWDKRVVTRLNKEVGECVAACSFKNIVDGFEWAFAGVYGPNGDRGGHGSDRGRFSPFSYPTCTPMGLKKSTRHPSKMSNTHAGSGIAGQVE
jgi:hypothetical protein